MTSPCGVKPVAPVSDQEFRPVGQRGASDADEQPMGALEVGDDPAVQTADMLVGDLDVSGRDPAVERDAKVALGPAEDEAGLAEADDLPGGAAVIEDGQQRDGWPARGAERAGGPCGDGPWCRRLLRDRRRVRTRLERERWLGDRGTPLGTGQEGLLNLLLGLGNGPGPLLIRV